jgi:putative ABC transport system permease protein
MGVRQRDALKDLDEELTFHFEQTVRDLRAKGLAQDEARREAHRRFGNEAAYRRALERIDGTGTRKEERVERMDVLRSNLTFALRGIGRSPGFAGAIIAILALGIGANAVMFGVVDRLLLSPPQHMRDADRVRHVYVERDIFNGTRPIGRTMTYPDYLDLQRVGAFQSVAAYTQAEPLTMGRGEEAERVRTIRASGSLFPLVGVAPVLGRFFNQEDDRLGANPVAVLSEEFWERRFGADPGVLGRRIELGQGTYEVVGVAPAGFTGVELEPVDLWLPIERAEELEEGGADWRGHRNWWWMRSVVRLRDGVSDEAAAAEATAAHRSGRQEQIEQDRYDANAELVLGSVIAARGPDPSAEARVAKWLGGVSLIVLLIACFNVANLLLARAARWRRELAVRTALGISRGRLLGQLLTESLVLALLGAVGALLVARWGGDALHQVLLPNVAFMDQNIGRRLLGFLGASSILTALLAGFLPALQASRAEVAHALRAGARSVSHGSGRLRATLLVAQASLSVVLLIGAGLFVVSLRGAQGTDLGFDAERIAYVRIEWSETLPGDERLRVFRDVAERVRSLPEVDDAALAMTIPFYSSIGIGRPRVPGLDSFPRHPNGGPYVNKVSPEYFHTMGLEILRGRGIEASDEAPEAAPVAVLTESMARAVWPVSDPLGQCIYLDRDDDDSPCTTVVGIVENFHRQELIEPQPHFMYFVNQGHPEAAGPPQALMVRTVGPPTEALRAISTAVRSTSTSIRFPVVRPLMDNIEPQLRSWRMGASMFTLFGLLALVVAALGLYSVLAFDVALRQSELGIRAALGAARSHLVSIVLRRAVTLVTFGVVLGSTVAFAAGRFVASLLYEVSPTNPLVYSGVALTLILVAGIAGSVPAWRVARIDPRSALQAE